MSIAAESRLSDAPFVESVTHGYTLQADTPIRPAESNWHFVFAKHQGTTRTFLVGPWSMAGQVSYPKDSEILWVRLKLGTYMPRLRTPQFIDSETDLSTDSKHTFWLDSATWERPNFENVESFAKRLLRAEVLAYDPLIARTLADEPTDLAPRTVRHRFLQATGLTQKAIRQMKRAQHAAQLLQEGMSILDTVFEAGYYDQSHLTRSLKLFVGYTPAQLQPVIVKE